VFGVKALEGVDDLLGVLLLAEGAHTRKAIDHNHVTKMQILRW